MRKPLGHRPISPLNRNVFVDSCAFDPKYHPEDSASCALFQMYENGDLGDLELLIAHSTQKELEHPNTPDWVRQEANRRIFTYRVTLTDEEIQRKATILRILAGKGNPEQVRPDAEHVFEASKYATYFVTTDSGILKKAEQLGQACGVHVCKPSEIIDIIRSYQAT